MSLAAILELPDLKIDCSKTSRIERGTVKIVRSVRPDWSKEDIILQRFESSTDTLIYGAYTIKDKAEMVMVKMALDLKGRDLKQEIASMRLFSSRYFGPRVFSAFHNGFAYEFTPGVPLDYHMCIDQNIYPNVAHKIGAMHREMSKLVSKVRGGHVFNSLRRWLKNLPEQLADPNQNARMQQKLPTKRDLDRELTELETSLNQPLLNRIVHCHGDLKPSNIIYDPRRDNILFINMECSGPNFQAYEIAQHFINFESGDLGRVGRDEFVPAKEFQRRWVAFYLSGYKDKPLEEVSLGEVDSLLDNIQSFCLVVLLREVIWSLARIDSIYYPDFDILQYGILRFQQYHRNKYNNTNMII